MLSIGVLADIHYGNSILDTKKLEKILVYLNHSCDYIVLLGDITNSGSIEEMMNIEIMLTNIVRKAKIVPIIGNHDCYKKNHLSKPDDSNFVRTFIDDIDAFKGDRYLLNYTFTVNNRRFICMDFINKGRFDGLRASLKDDQLSWLDEVLSTSKEKSIIFSHIPLHSPYESGWQNEFLFGAPTLGIADFNANKYKTVCNTIKKHSKKIEFWISGHGHLDKQKYDENAGIDIIEIASFFKQNKYKIIVL
jgi:predicted phosphodiesterase